MDRESDSEAEEQSDDVNTPRFPDNVAGLHDLELGVSRPDDVTSDSSLTNSASREVKRTSFTMRGKCAALMTSARAPTKYKCEVCGQLFATRWVLTRHRLVHKPNKIKCHVCDKWFTRKDNLNYHVAKYHPPTLLAPATSATAS